MTVYVDNMKAPHPGIPKCYMIADTEEELEAMAVAIGAKVAWWQDKGTKRSRFEISKGKRAKALNNGAVKISDRQLSCMAFLRDTPDDRLCQPQDALRLRQEQVKK